MTLLYVETYVVEKCLCCRCLVHPAADDDFVICQNAPCGLVLMLPSPFLVRLATDDDFVICQNSPSGQVLVLPNQRLVHPSADNDFVKYFTVYKDDDKIKLLYIMLPEMIGYVRCFAETRCVFSH